MRHFQQHRRDARAALNARLGRLNVNDLTSRQAAMFSLLTLLDLEELSMIGKHGLV